MRGLSEHLVETADFMVRIPMRGGCDWINVSVAAGVLLFEMSNQRRGSLTAIPQGIQADELPATAHFCLFAETRSSTSFVRAPCMLTVRPCEVRWHAFRKTLALSQQSAER